MTDRKGKTEAVDDNENSVFKLKFPSNNRISNVEVV